MPIIPLNKILEDNNTFSGGGCGAVNDTNGFVNIKSMKCVSTPENDDIDVNDLAIPLSYSCTFKQERIPFNDIMNKPTEPAEIADEIEYIDEPPEETPELPDDVYNSFIENSNEIYNMNREDLPDELSQEPIIMRPSRRIATTDSPSTDVEIIELNNDNDIFSNKKPSSSSKKRTTRRKKVFIPKDSILLTKKKYTKRRRNRDKSRGGTKSILVTKKNGRKTKRVRFDNTV